jgi:hypothetical protein
MLPNRSRLPRLSRTVIVASTNKSMSKSQNKKPADFRCNERSRKSVTVVVAEKRRTMERLTGFWLGLINPVGAPLEDVVVQLRNTR